jgi:hypothetical protein
MEYLSFISSFFSKRNKKKTNRRSEKSIVRKTSRVDEL